MRKQNDLSETISMTYSDFTDWVNRHRFLSFLLIVLFCLSVASQMLGYFKRVYDFFTPDGNFEIVRFEISTRNSVYYEWDKLASKYKDRARKTLIDDSSYRQFRYAENYYDNFGKHPGRGIAMALLVMQYAISKLDLPDDVSDKFSYFLEGTPESKQDFKKFFYELVPKERFRHVPGTDTLIPFRQGNHPIHKHFLLALRTFYDEPTPFEFTLDRKSVKQTKVEALVLEHIAFFTGAFLPVYEVHLENNSRKAVTIDKVGVEVIEIVEYMGGAEAIPASKIITVPVEHEKGMNELKLNGDKQVYIEKGKSVRVLLRLEPKGRFSSYLVRIHLCASNGVCRETDIFALDM